MFELGLFTDEVSQELEIAIKLAKEFDNQGILSIRSLEIRSLWQKKGPHELSDEDITRIKSITDREGFKIVSIASPFFKCDLGDSVQYNEHMKILKKCISVGKKLNANIIRGFTFWRAPAGGRAPAGSGELNNNWNKIIDNFKEPKKIVEDEGIMLGIENEAACFIGAGRDLARFIKEINSDNIKAIWDPANEIFDPTGENPYPDGYNHVKDLIVHVHLKDAVKKGTKNEPECVCVGDGEVDYKGQLKALIDDGYKGCVSLETHWRPTRELTQELMNKPGGNVYSESGEIASRSCLQNIYKIMNSIKNPINDRIKSVLENRINPMLKGDGGGVKLTDFKDGVVMIKLTGACAGCPMAQMTIQNGIERILKEEIPEIKRVEAELL